MWLSEWQNVSIILKNLLSYIGLANKIIVLLQRVVILCLVFLWQIKSCASVVLFMLGSCVKIACRYECNISKQILINSDG